MPRPTAHPKPPSPALSPRRPEVRQLARLFRHRPLTLRDYHRAGELLRQLQDDPEVASLPGWRGAVAEAVGVSEATLNKSLQFRLSYWKGELAELERLRVGWGLLTVALAVPDRRQRHALLRRAAQEEWGGRELQREVQRLNGSWRGGGGRREERGHGLLPDLAELAGLTRRWQEFHDGAWSAGQKGYARELRQTAKDGRPGVRRALEGALQALAELRKRCRAAERAVKALRDRLPAGAAESRTAAGLVRER
jgi:hypothetical protein